MSEVAQQDVSAKIEAKSDELEKYRLRLNRFVSDKEMSVAEVAYLKAKGIGTETMKAEGKPVSIISDVVKGECAELKGDLTDAEIRYKAILVNIQILQSQMNGFQSINRTQATL